MNSDHPNAAEGTPWSGVRHVTVLCSELAGFSERTWPGGDAEAARVAGRLLGLQEIIITRDNAGQVLHKGGDSLLAVFPTASAALNRALEIQRVVSGEYPPGDTPARPRIRMGLHMGEVLLREGERIEVISRQVHRARCVMEAAQPGQVLASAPVAEAAREFVNIPKEHLAIQHYGQYYLKGAGATDLCEVADVRFKTPRAPETTEVSRREGVLLGRLELAGYRNLTRLGEGPHGVVYRAEESETGRAVALKILDPFWVEEAKSRQQFEQGLTRLRRSLVSGMGTILDSHLDHQPPFMVMELIEGRPVTQALAGTSWTRVAKVFRQACSVLEQIHAAGVIHGSLKAENVMIGPNGSPVLLDAGGAGLYRDGAGEGTPRTGWHGWPSVLAPESIRGAAVDARSDVYSLGVLLFQVLAGRGPFDATGVHQLLEDHLHTDPPLPAEFNPAVPDGLQRIALKALEKDPRSRYPGPREMREDLERFLRGDVIHTRPSVYDNLLLHRVQQHVEQVRDWAGRGLLNEEEKNGLLSAYEGLQRKGLPAVMESRVQRFWQTLVYVSGWAVINGALIWLLTHYGDLTRAGKLLLGSIPALTAFLMAAAMWRAERFRLTFVALVVGVLALPLLTGVWLYEFHVAATVPAAELKQELFAHQPAAGQVMTRVTNHQLLITFLSALAVAAGVMRFTRTMTHSTQTALALALAYSCGLLCWFGLKPLGEDQHFAIIAMQYLPLLAVTGLTSAGLLRNRERNYQAPPWVYFSGLLLTGILYALSLRALEDWTNLERQDRLPGSYLLLSGAGVVQTLLGLWARGHLQHRCRAATMLVVLIGLVNVLAGLGLAGWEENWPQNWWRPSIFHTPVPAAHLAMPALSLVMALLASRVQMLSFLLVGLAGFATSIHLLGWKYFERTTAWPKCMIVVGAVCFFAALFLELRRTRGHAVDDLVGQKRL